MSRLKMKFWTGIHDITLKKTKFDKWYLDVKKTNRMKAMQFVKTELGRQSAYGKRVTD